MELPPEFIKACETSLGTGSRLQWDNMAVYMRSKLKPEEIRVYSHEFKQIIHRALSANGTPMAQTVNKTWSRLLQRATAPLPAPDAPTASKKGGGAALSKKTQEALKELESIDPHETMLALSRHVTKGGKLPDEDKNAFLTLLGSMQELLDTLGIKNPYS